MTEPGEYWFGVLLYAAPVIVVVCLEVSIRTARLARGFFVPAITVMLLAADAVVLATTFAF